MLKELTKENHTKAENSRFVKALFKKELPAEAYADYLANQNFVYRVLENLCSENGLLEGIEDIKRTDKIQKDCFNLGMDARLYDSSIKYGEHICQLPKELLVAHLYVRHFGDMYGGQMIKKMVPGTPTMYDFENKEELISKVREMLHDGLADEANRCFEFAIELFDEIANEHNL